MLVHPGYPGILGTQAQDVNGLDQEEAVRMERERERRLREIPKLAFRTMEGREEEEVVKNGSKVSGLRWSRLGG